ncbi:hypothetical protein MAPG_11246 [Magnaporthiopsis poae ATCC 64411]|uniref:Uncharacterized protein n=1 Tax=Magnaporthiopsis poae (strain ATCC 64411 / 73-15) TaxID=644358 RepID=A0A0C4EER7_MAGP6|nr:hypothetical protein MAPG_11246 [Magnaporthiopsis poae ATCC 64411]
MSDDRRDSHCADRQLMENPGQHKMADTPAPEASTTTQFSLPLPRSLDTRIYVHLTVRPKSILLCLTTATADEQGSPSPMGSFVYAIPDVNIHSLPCISIPSHCHRLRN